MNTHFWRCRRRNMSYFFAHNATLEEVEYEAKKGKKCICALVFYSYEHF